MLVLNYPSQYKDIQNGGIVSNIPNLGKDGGQIASVHSISFINQTTHNFFFNN
jgi:hypothetical protein